MPDVFVIAGPNGAGKTTSAMSLLPDVLKCLEYVNADTIAAGISPFNPNNVAVEAGRLMLQRIKKLAHEGKNFAFETTLASRSFVGLLQEWQQKFKYNVTLIYFWLESPELALDRVNRRVLSGGHDIPKDVVIRRYYRSINNLFNLYLPICNNVFIFNNSNERPYEVAQKEIDENIEILHQETWELLEKNK